MDTLKEYINTNDYEMGVRLYRELIGEDYFYSLLLRGQNSYTEETLYKKLEAQYHLVEQPKAKAEKKSTPAEVFRLREKAQSLMNERAELKANLRIQYFRKLDEPKTRTEQVFRIKAIRHELDEVFETLNYYDLHGVLLPVQKQQPENPRKRLTNLRTYVTKYSKALDDGETFRGKKMTPDDVIKYKTKLTEYTLKLDKLTKTLEKETLEYGE